MHEFVCTKFVYGRGVGGDNHFGVLGLLAEVHGDSLNAAWHVCQHRSQLFTCIQKLDILSESLILKC